MVSRETDGSSPAYRLLAAAFIAEGVDTCFALLGDGNMKFCAALAETGSARMIYGRHENAVVSMANAYARASGRVGIASVTCGPGVTQIGTALTIASRARIPLVIFAGEAPIAPPFYMQRMEQGPFVAACGAHYISAHHLDRLNDCVQEAFVIAKVERRPVVLGVPYDLQGRMLATGKAYVPSTEIVPAVGRMQPDPEYVEKAAAMIAAAQRVVLVGGRGVGASQATDACLELAEHRGALLATTLPARGEFDASPYSLGIIGGFSSKLAEETLSRADLVILVGASLAHHASRGGTMFPQAKVIQIDTNPVGRNQGQRVADLYLRADARDGVRAILRRLGTDETKGWRSPELARRIAEEPYDDAIYERDINGLDPRDVAAELDRTVPKDWDIVSGAGHCSYFFSNMRGRGPGKFHAIREFGVIGDGLAYAIGVAAARPGLPIVLMEGDGSILMHVQELETARRHGLDLLICIFNDGAYGAEIHKLRAQGLAADGAEFGPGDLAAVACGFGHTGTIIRTLDELPPAIEKYRTEGGTHLLDIRISDKVLSPNMRRTVAA